jgi:hypothetical protein
LEDPISWLDLYYSSQILAKLEKVVRRASGLEFLEPALPSANVEKYFNEAHQCFLYGFPIATAVLCRAILEAQLKAALDPDGKIESGLKSKESYSRVLIEKAVEKGLLEGTKERRGRNARHWAEEIIDAGNWAIHDLQRFNKTYGPDERVNELLLVTRKALVQLLTRGKR